MGFQLLIFHLIRKTTLFGEMDCVCDGQFNMLLCPVMLSCVEGGWQFGCCALKVWFLISDVYRHRICVSSQIKSYIKDTNISTAMNNPSSQRPSSDMDQYVLNLAKIENVH